MKRLLLMLGMFLAAVALPVMTVQAETVTFKKVIEVPGATEKQVMDRVSNWAGSYAQASQVDTKTGTVTAKGEITYPSPPVDRIQYTISYDMKNKIQGNKNTVTFENVMLKSPTTYDSENSKQIAGQVSPIKTDRDRAVATSRLTYVTDNLEAYLLGKSDVACPLTKCPECAALCPTSEEMKEHMKSHPGHGTTPKK